MIERPYLCFIILTKKTNVTPMCLSGLMFIALDLIYLERD
jgi:hypothetical protein